MNRRERRALAKQVVASGGRKENGKPRIKFKNAFAEINESYKLREFEEGDTVLLSYSWIKSQPDYKFQPQEFFDWLEKNDNGVFHVKYDPKMVESGNPDYKKFVCLEEDETEPKWVLRSDALIPVKVKLDENKEAKEVENSETKQEEEENVNGEINS